MAADRNPPFHSLTGLRGAPATVERKLHDFRVKSASMALTRHRGEGATAPGQVLIQSSATAKKRISNLRADILKLLIANY